jgi:hypothetical protein
LFGRASFPNPPSIATRESAAPAPYGSLSSRCSRVLVASRPFVSQPLHCNNRSCLNRESEP